VHGNPIHQEADLGLEGGFIGLRIVVLDFYKTFEYCKGKPKEALEAMGFEVIYHQLPPSPADLTVILEQENIDQLWLISTTEILLNDQHVDAIDAYHLRGGSLYLWGDDNACNLSVNFALKRILPGIQIDGNYPAKKYLTRQAGNYDSKLKGFFNHAIFTGIENLYEGYTIGRFIGQSPHLTYIMNSTEPKPALGISEGFNGRGRIAVDVGFTRLYFNWDDAGTERFVKNIAAWLHGLDADWI
jgi:hypothetical protein